MKPLAIAVVLMCVVGNAGAQSETPAPNRYAGQLESDIQSDKAIRELYAQFTAAWNKHDVPAMAGMWVEDGDQVDPDGHVAKGRAEVTQLLTAQHNSVSSCVTSARTLATCPSGSTWSPSSTHI